MRHSSETRQGVGQSGKNPLLKSSLSLFVLHEHYLRAKRGQSALMPHTKLHQFSALTTLFLRSPSRSTSSSTTSPGKSHLWTSAPNSRIEPVPTVPDPKMSPGCKFTD